MREWNELRVFSGINLERSFVLSWNKEGDELKAEMDLVLNPAHPFYETPRPAERECFRPGLVVFPQCASVNGRQAEDVDPEQLNYGRIESFRELNEGCYELLGVFGRVLVESEEPTLQIHNHQ